MGKSAPMMPPEPWPVSGQHVSIIRAPDPGPSLRRGYFDAVMVALVIGGILVALKLWLGG